MPISQALERKRQKAYKYKAHLAYIERHCFKDKTNLNTPNHTNILEWTIVELEAPRKSVNAWEMCYDKLFWSRSIRCDGRECRWKGKAKWQRVWKCRTLEAGQWFRAVVRRGSQGTLRRGRTEVRCKEKGKGDQLKCSPRVLVIWPWSLDR